MVALVKQRFFAGFILFHLYGLSSSWICENLMKLSSKDRTSNSSTKVIFVNINVGKDTDSCGVLKQKPCKTISYSVRQAFLSRNTSLILFNISQGRYKEAESVRLDCSKSAIFHFVFQGSRKSGDTETDISIDATMCSVVFVNIHWKLRSAPVLLNVLFTNFSLCECTVEYTSFSIIGLASSVEVHGSTLSHCWGWQPHLPLLSLGSLHNYQGTLLIAFSKFSYNRQILGTRSLLSSVVLNSSFVYNTMPTAQESILTVDSEMFLVQGSNFEKNSGSVLCLKNDSTTNVTDSLFSANAVQTGSVIIVERNSAINVLNSVFKENFGAAKGPVVSVQSKGDNVMMKDCYFSCNRVNGSVHASPVATLEGNKVSCHNCTINPECSVFCEGGKFLHSGLLCYNCPKGTYSKDTMVNITTISCSKCPAGFYNPMEGRKECLKCEAGYFSSREGSTFCQQCKNDFFTSDKGQSSCLKMTVGFIVLTTVVALLIVVPLVVLLVRRYSKGTKKPHFQLVDTNELQSGNSKIQNDNSSNS